MPRERFFEKSAVPTGAGVGVGVGIGVAGNSIAYRSLSFARVVVPTLSYSGEVAGTIRYLSWNLFTALAVSGP